MRQYLGPVLIGIGGLHTAIGVTAFRPQLLAIARDGIFDAVEPHPERQAAFWFEMTGVVLMLWGANTTWIERQTGRLPPAVAWQLLGVGSLGVVLMPRSGFWSLLAAALLAWGGRAAPEPAGPAAGLPPLRNVVKPAAAPVSQTSPCSTPR